VQVISPQVISRQAKPILLVSLLATTLKTYDKCTLCPNKKWTPKPMAITYQKLISPPGNDSFRSGLMFYCKCFFLNFFNARSPSSIGQSSWNFARWL